MGKSNLIGFIKKIKSPITLISSAEVDEEAKDLEDESKGRSEKEELNEKDSYYLEPNFNCKILASYNCNNYILNFYTLLFKTHFKEVVTPPPKLV